MEASLPDPGTTGWFAFPPGPRITTPRLWRLPLSEAEPRTRIDPARPVTLMPEYHVELPLWGYAWQDLGLPAALLDDLADWQETFDVNFRAEEGWVDTAIRDAWARQAAELVDQLRQALPRDVPLEVDLWPLEPEEGEDQQS